MMALAVVILVCAGDATTLEDKKPTGTVMDNMTFGGGPELASSDPRSETHLLVGGVA